MHHAWCSWYLDLQLEELDVADGFLEHGDQVDLGAVGHQLLQRPQPLADPLTPILQQERAQITGMHAGRGRGFDHQTKLTLAARLWGSLVGVVDGDLALLAFLPAPQCFLGLTACGSALCTQSSQILGESTCPSPDSRAELRWRGTYHVGPFLRGAAHRRRRRALGRATSARRRAREQQPERAPRSA